MGQRRTKSSPVSQRDYETLAAFRLELRKFLAASETAARALGMTPQQHQSLLAIRAAPDCSLSVGDLADQLVVQPHTASALADRMEALGWVRRQASVIDRRKVALVLTEPAVEMLSLMSETHRDEVMRISGTLTDLLARLETP